MSDKQITEDKLYTGLKTNFIGRKIFLYREVNSTNTTAVELAKKYDKEGIIVIAEKQTGGKGRRGRNWHSPSGTGLWFSIILKPQIIPKYSHFLTINASLAVYRALKARDFNCDIKWPNDILYNNYKICGILSELNATSRKIKFAVTGIGINVNQESFPDNIADKAISLYKINNKRVDRIGLFQDILSYFENYYLRFLNGDKKELLEEWKSKIGLLGKKIQVNNDSEIFQGKAVDIAEDGRLVIHTSNGEIKKFWSGDTSIIK